MRSRGLKVSMETDRRTAAKESVDKPCVAHPPQMLSVDVQFCHETHGHGHVRDCPPTILSHRTEVHAHVSSLDRVQRRQSWVKAILQKGKLRKPRGGRQGSSPKEQSIYLESQQTDTTPVARTGWHGSEGNGEGRSGVLVLGKSVEYFVGKSITGEDNNSVVVQRQLLRDLCRVSPVCSNCRWSGLFPTSSGLTDKLCPESIYRSQELASRSD